MEDVVPNCAIEIKPKADENTVLRVLAKQKDAENFVAEYNRRALQRRAAQKRESDSTKTGEDISADNATPKRFTRDEGTRSVAAQYPALLASSPEWSLHLDDWGWQDRGQQPAAVGRHCSRLFSAYSVTQTCLMVVRFPQGGKLAEWAHSFEELHAKDELEWAAEEEDPIELLPCDISLIIRDMDHRPSMIRESFYESHKTVRVLSCHYMRIPERRTLSRTAGRHQRFTRFSRIGYLFTFSLKS